MGSSASGACCAKPDERYCSSCRRPTDELPGLEEASNRTKYAAGGSNLPRQEGEQVQLQIENPQAAQQGGAWQGAIGLKLQNIFGEGSPRPELVPSSQATESKAACSSVRITGVRETFDFLSDDGGRNRLIMSSGVLQWMRGGALIESGAVLFHSATRRLTCSSGSMFMKAFDADRLLDIAIVQKATIDPSLPPSYFDRELKEPGPLCLRSEPQRCRCLYGSGAEYDGEWLDGARHGMGMQSWPDGTTYIGQWGYGRAHGCGQLRHCDGDVYTGQWRDGRAHGHGVLRFQESEAIYEGEFANDFRSGHGVERWVADGSKYLGAFSKGEKTGFGEQHWPDGTSYSGSWSCNNLCGSGRYVVHAGPSYSGQWRGSAIHGVGVYIWPTSFRYEGQYFEDAKDGFGVLTDPQGDRVVSFWKKGQKLDPLRGGDESRQSGT